MGKEYGIEGRLASVLSSLLESRSYDSISVRDITASAAITPRTFYSYFSSKDELLSFIIMTDLRNAAITVPSSVAEWERIRFILAHIRRNKAIYKVLAQETVAHSVHAGFRRLMQEFIAGSFPRIIDDIQPYLFFADAVVLSVYQWLEEAVPLSPDKQVMLLKKTALQLSFFLQKTQKDDFC